MAAAPGWALGLPARRSRCHPRAHTLPVAAMAARTARPRDAAHGQRADGALQRRLRSRVQRLSAAGGASLQRAGARLWARPPRELRPGRRRARRRARGAEAEQRAEPATRRAARHAWRDVSRTVSTVVAQTARFFRLALRATRSNLGGTTAPAIWLMTPGLGNQALSCSLCREFHPSRCVSSTRLMGGMKSWTWTNPLLHGGKRGHELALSHAQTGVT